MATDETPLSLPMTLTYLPEVRTVQVGQSLEVGPADLVFFQSISPGAKPPTMTFIVLRRTSPE